VEANSISYNASMSACEMVQQSKRALSLPAQMEAHGVEASMIIYNAAMHAF